MKPNTKQTANAGGCLAFTFRAFGEKNGWGFQLARQAWDGQANRHPGKKPPKGVRVPVWFDHWGTYSGVYKNWGHAAISLGDGSILSSPLSGHGQVIFRSIADLERRLGARYLGWSESLDGTQIVGPDLPGAKPSWRRLVKRLKPGRSNVRAQPTTKSRVTRTIRSKGLSTVVGWTRGERVRGSDIWFKVAHGWVHSSRFRTITAGTTRFLREF